MLLFSKFGKFNRNKHWNSEYKDWKFQSKSVQTYKQYVIKKLNTDFWHDLTRLSQNLSLFGGTWYLFTHVREGDVALSENNFI